MQKDSIKREQSQAGLSFAERKNFRPKVKRNRLLLLLVLLLTAATGAWADNTVTWEGATLKSVNVASYGENNKTQTIGDITVTANSGYFKDFGSGNNGVIASAYETNGLVFSANAKFKSVEVTASSESTFNHTSGSATSHTYTVNPTATSFALPYGDGWINITKIVFTFEDAAAEPAGYTVSMKDGVKDADKWTITPNPAEEGQTVTVTYTGSKKVIGVKAEKKSAAAPKAAKDATAEDVGKVMCDKGHLHDAKTPVPDGCTAVGILGKVTETGHGLILALQDAAQQNWNTINGWTSVNSYAGTTLKQLPAGALGSLTSYTTLGSTTVSNWCVAQKSDYDAIFQNLDSTQHDQDGYTYDGNVNAYITTGVGGTAISDKYWSATRNSENWAYDIESEYWNVASVTETLKVRPVLAF